MDGVENDRRLKTRQIILDEAERLIRSSPKHDFAMRDLAREAGMSLRTLFAQFGAKSGIYAGLASRMLDEVGHRFEARRPGRDPVENVFLMIDVGVAYVLHDIEYYRAIGAGIVTETEKSETRQLYLRTEQLWRLALSGTQFKRSDLADADLSFLPTLLSSVYRGAQELWISESISDGQFRPVLERSMAGVLLGFVEDAQRQDLLARFKG